MIFRFTLNNTIEGSHQISDPDGWKEVNLTLERDTKYHSLVEMADLPLIFYRSNDLADGGYDYILNVEQTQGIDAEIEILIECSDDGGETYETFFNGLLEIETIKDISDAEAYKLECNIIRNDIWSKFINRESQQVNLNSDIDLDGNGRTEINDFNLYLPGQKIRVKSETKLLNGIVIGEDWVTDTEFNNRWLQFSFDPQIDELETMYNLPISFNEQLPFELYTFKYDGEYRLQAKLICGIVTGAGHQVVSILSDLDVFYQLNQETEVAFIESSTSSDRGADQPRVFSMTVTINAKANDTLRIYGKFVGETVGTRTGLLIYGEDNSNVDIGHLFLAGFGDTEDFGNAGDGGFSFINITGDTLYTSTQTDAFLLRDAAESVLSKIVGRDNVLFSNFLGDETPTACGANFAIMKGLHVRGYSMFDKPMFMSFDNWWEGANPILNLGLGYEEIGGTTFIRIEDKASFYDENPSMTISNVDKIIRTYHKEKIFKSVEVGYKRWAAESASGIDDPQTKKKYNTRFKFVGRDESILSEFIAASLAIEQTRRNRIEVGKDWRLDEDIIIIALGNDSSPYQPELDENFSNITGLLNPETRYNLRLTPARNFERWKPFFNGCLQAYVNNSPCEYYRFASAEGNYDMVSTCNSDCDEGRVAEDEDICVTDSYLFTHIQLEFEVDMSWEEYKTLRDNRKNAILVSNSSVNHKTCFIQKMIWNHFDAKAKFNVWIKDTNFTFDDESTTF